MLEQDWLLQCAHLLEDEAKIKELEAKDKITLSRPNSTCPKCQHAIKPWENIPVISYLFLKGKCNQYKSRISPRYQLVELATDLLKLNTIVYFGATYKGL